MAARTRARVVPVAGLVLLGAPGIGTARPKPTPLARLEPMPVASAGRRAVPRMLPVDLSRLVPVGDLRLEVRDDGVVEGLSMRALARTPHAFGLRSGCLVYRVRGHEAIPAGVARVVELHPLGQGLERVVFTATTDTATVRFTEGPQGRSGSPRIDWEPGTSPGTDRYFVHPDNLTGMPQAEYRRLVEGKLWVGMEASRARLAMGRPDRVEVVESRFGRRERWTYPVHLAHSRWLVFSGGQLVSWRDSWRKPEPMVSPGSILRADRWY